MKLLIYQVEYPENKKNYDASCLQSYIHGIYIKLTEKDNIILFYKNDFFIGNNKLREFIISKEKKLQMQSNFTMNI